MEIVIVLCLVVLGFLFLIKLLNNNEAKNKKSIQYIDTYVFPEKITIALKNAYPHLEDNDVQTIMEGLKDYFKICSLSEKNIVSMPSQAVDVAWHEFILFTKQYEEFCKKTLGRFLHHVPAEAMEKPYQSQDGIKRAWYFACLLENIDPKHPDKLPIIFAIDSMFNIPNGIIYKLNYNPGKDEHFTEGSGGCGGVGCGGN